VDGTVVSRNVTGGQTVAASFQTPTLFLIATDLKKMEVDTNTSEGDIGGVKDGDSVTFSVDAFPQRVFQGRVTQVRKSPQTVQNVVTYDVVVGIDNSDLALVPGMTASTQIIIDQRSDVLKIPTRRCDMCRAASPRLKPGALLRPGLGHPKSGCCVMVVLLPSRSLPASAMTISPRLPTVISMSAIRSLPPKVATKRVANRDCRRRGSERVPCHPKALTRYSRPSRSRTSFALLFSTM
jgi:hypothetical protein